MRFNVNIYVELRHFRGELPCDNVIAKKTML
jgi:hypothetical protein